MTENESNAEGSETSSTPVIPGGPVPGVKYPLVVHYCGECSMPIEYCEYSGKKDKCRLWLEQNLPEMIAEVDLTKDSKGDDDEKKHQKRGGKGAPKAEKVEKGKAPSKITVQRAPRGKNKSVTVIKGLTTFGIDLKVASKFFASKFACGSSVTGPDEIVIQGDIKDELFDIIPEKWKQVDEDSIEDLGDQKR